MVVTPRPRQYAINTVVSVICIILVAIFAGFAGFGCDDDDPVRPKRPTVSPPTYQDLTERDHVLNNLELCYNQRNLAQYEKLLDDDFIFFFSEADFGSGATPEQWNRQQDLESHAHMFDPNYTGENKALSIKLSLDYTKGETSWTATIPDQDLFPGETWYFKPVVYHLTVVAERLPENITYIGNNITARFTVRQTEVQGKQIWRIVEWHDDVDTKTAGALRETKTEETSWGKVKSLYGS